MYFNLIFLIGFLKLFVIFLILLCMKGSMSRDKLIGSEIFYYCKFYEVFDGVIVICEIYVSEKIRS